MATLTPSKQLNFVFIRRKLQTKIKEFRKLISLDSGRYNRKKKRRTLAQILSLSRSKELSLYTVDDVVPGFGKDGTVVHYSRPECEDAEFRKEVQEKLDKQEAKLKVQQDEIDELKKKIGGNSEVLAEWQTASLVICAFGSFAWNLVSGFDKTELSQYNICKFWDLYHAQTKPGPARNFARRIYHKIDENVISCANNLVRTRRDVTNSRRNLANPIIPEARLRNFLSELGSGDAGLEPIEIEMFSYLTSRSNDPENIERAIKVG